jgi:hypothetical protein
MLAYFMSDENIIYSELATKNCMSLDFCGFHADPKGPCSPGFECKICNFDGPGIYTCQPIA